MKSNVATMVVGGCAGVDRVIQNVKRRAHGFENMDYFATMIYLTCSKLGLQTATA